MLRKELAWTAFSYAVSAVIGILLLWKLWPQRVELAWVVAAIVGTNVAAMLYHRRVKDKAPLGVKATAGAVLAVCALATGLLSYGFLHVFRFPEISIPIATVGSFVFPFVLFGTMQKAYNQDHGQDKKDGDR